jgi:hypothetical protein
MAKYSVLCWKDIPTVVKAEDGRGEVSLQLDSRFQEKIDRLAMQQGLAGTDDYLEQWQWSEPQQRTGSAQEVAESLKSELEKQLEE